MNVNSNIAVTGEITANFYDQSVLDFLDRFINRIILKFRDNYPGLMKYYRLGELKKTEKKKNVICNAGFNAIAKRLCNDNTYTGYINKMALGTGSPTPAASDTELDTETYRNTTASSTSSSNVAYLTAYFTETECNGTYTEFGNFIDGTTTPDSGQLWSHIASISWVKNSTTCLVVSCQYTFASA
jgi:hypothetical protein